MSMKLQQIGRPVAARRVPHAGALLALAAAVLPPLLLSGYALDSLSEVGVFAIAAIGLDLLLGYGGMVSFGHAAFFGLGAYTTVLVATTYDVSPWLGLLAAVALTAVAAALIGAFCVRLNGVSFFMVTLAFSQLLFSAAVKWRWLTGGSDGVGGLDRPSIFGISTDDPKPLYWLMLALLLASMAVMRVLVRSQFGRALVGVRENELRMAALGVRTRQVKLLAFIVGGALAGVSGGAYAFYNSFVSPESLSFATSGMLLLMVVLGGKGTIVGPLIGAAFFLLMKNTVSSHTEHWMLIVGGIFIACVLFFPDGIYGLVRRLLQRRAG